MKLFLLLWLLTTSLSMQINWSGYKWNIRNQEKSGPGPNVWSEKNVFVDQDGNLHLRVVNDQGVWTCAELFTEVQFKFGTFQWWVIGRIDQYDRNVVAGLFLYPSSYVDGTNQIDIQFAQWGDSKNKRLWYTVWPRDNSVKQISQDYDMALNGDYTTHRFNWKSSQLIYQSLHGHQTGFNLMFANWTTPNTYSDHVPVMNLQLHINLWLFQGKAPTNGQQHELVLKQFRHY